jgi:hypothetical protein
MLGVCVTAAVAEPAGQVGAPSVRAAFLRLAAAPLWPGFAPGETPLAIMDGQRTATATILLPCTAAAESAEVLAAVAVHEAYHVFQRARHARLTPACAAVMRRPSRARAPRCSAPEPPSLASIP